jgi:hypothetical protein
MTEKGFVDSLKKQIEKGFHRAVVVRPSDNFSLGIPDLLAWIPVENRPELGPPVVWAVAIEAKQLTPLMEDPFHKGRRIGQMLKHPFTGPQVSMLRKLGDAGVDAFGLVRASSDTAFRFDPYHIPANTGNFTHEELVEFGAPIQRVNGIWQFWSTTNGHIPGPRHRDDP